MHRWFKALPLAFTFVVLSATPALAGFSYTVRWGDSLYLLSQRYGVTIEAIRQANGLRGYTIYAGQRLYIPDPVSPTAYRARTTSGGQGSLAATYTEIQLLARLVQAEAASEPYAGKVAVAAVVLNRVRSPWFPRSISGVIFQPGEFEPVSTGYLWQVPVTQEALQAVYDALAGWDPTGGALFFFNPAKAWSGFLWSRPQAAWIGSHLFLL